MKPAISVEGISKEYLLGSEQIGQQSFREMIVGSLTTPFRKFKRLSGQDEEQERFWALKDVSFEVEQGEIVGVIGRNGAGKSTLLKILSRITSPTLGKITYRGRSSSLLEIGTGFHPELTGRENIYLNGTILGMRKLEVSHCLDEIVDFAGIGQFLDTPVKRYSSGMYVRLAFSVAAHLNTDILIVDEVLAVGDISFQRKCIGKMQDVAGTGKTVLFVSHNMQSISALCNKGLLIKNGSISVQGEIAECIGQYKSDNIEISNQSLKNRSDRKGSGYFLFEKFWVENTSGDQLDWIATGENIRFCFTYKRNINVRDVSLSFNLYDTDGYILLYFNSEHLGSTFTNLPETGTIFCTVPNFPLNSGVYTGNVQAICDGVIADWIKTGFNIEVDQNPSSEKKARYPVGTFVSDYQWEVK